MRISPTAIDAWLDLTEGRLPLAAHIRRLKRQEPPTPAMERGTRFHAMLEELTKPFAHPDDQDATVAKHGFACEPDIDIPLVDANEMWATTRIAGHTLNGRIDAKRGQTIIDWKTCSGWTYPGVNKTDPRIDLFDFYRKKAQWKCYMVLDPAAVAFEYRFFQIYESRREGTPIQIKEAKTLRLNRYAGIEEEVIGLVTGYVDYLHRLQQQGHIRLNAKGVIPEPLTPTKGTTA